MGSFPALVACTTLALLLAAEGRLPPGDDCLLWYGHGCAAITDRDLCLSTRDGRPWRKWNNQLISGEPCVWCGGQACRTHSSKLCLPYDWVKDQMLKETANSTGTPSRFTVASCDKGGPPLTELETPTVGRNVTFDRMHTLGQPNIGQACRANHIVDDGRNANYYWVFTAMSLAQCKAFCASKHYCRGIEYRAEEKHCELWWHPIQWTQAKSGYECYRIATRDDVGSDSNLDCLSYTARGPPGACTWIMDKDVCMNSRDGRDSLSLNGLKVHGQPCVWCGGRQCTTLTVSKCEPYDWLVRGETRGLFKFLAHDNYSVANCPPPRPRFRPTTTAPPANETNTSIVVLPQTSEPEGGSSPWLLYWGLIGLAVLLGLLCLAVVLGLAGRSSGKDGRSKRRRPSANSSGAEDDGQSDEERAPMLQAEERVERTIEPVDKPPQPQPQHQGLAAPLVPFSLPSFPRQISFAPQLWAAPQPVPLQPVPTAAVRTTVMRPAQFVANVTPFDLIDTNRDGVIDRNEFVQAHARGQVAFTPGL